MFGPFGRDSFGEGPLVQNSTAHELARESAPNVGRKNEELVDEAIEIDARGRRDAPRHDGEPEDVSVRSHACFFQQGSARLTG